VTLEPEHPVELHELSIDDNKRLVEAITYLRRNCGARAFQLRYSDDEQPVIWMALAIVEGGGHEVAASLHPVRAVERLCERLCADAKRE
jgi:hypothetical protein